MRGGAGSKRDLALLARLICSRCAFEALPCARASGRMETVRSGREDMIGVVDYAHNGTSMEALLTSLRASYPRGTWQLTLVFGATGSKGLDRRRDMARAAAAAADLVIVTEDDPGEEDPRSICADIARVLEQRGCPRHITVIDREQAIREAVRLSCPPAVVVCAGKGPDRYMARAGRHDPYEGDAAVLARELKRQR